jgi:hypothetical protein
MRATEYPEKFTHAELVELGRDWLIKPYAVSAPHGHSACGVVITEIVASTWAGEQPDVLGFCPKKSILIECKTSLSDFRADRNKPFREHPEFGIGCQRWFIAPMGIIPKSEIPPKWGLLEVTRGRSILVIARPEIQNRNYESEISIFISLLRRLNIMPDNHVAIRKYEIRACTFKKQGDILY